MALDLGRVGKPSEATTLDYSWKDVILYALGVGAKKDELDYLYEGRGPKVLPGFIVVATFKPMLELLAQTGGNMAMVIYGGERVTMHGPLAPQGKLVTTATIRAIYDLKRFAQVVVDSRSQDAAGRLVAETTSSILFRGEGGFGGQPPPKESARVDKPRDTPPTFSFEEATTPEQALLYRLSGDHNPLHADPHFAQAVGFERGPILHGLGTLGFMVRHVAKAVLSGDATRLRAFEAQFRRPVWPGETLVTEGWLVRPDAAALQVKVKERDEVVIAGAWALLD
ncbi:MAG: MaoC family dehydratase N-terminal domain-containing protein [Myxococcota bacterium]|nr:MaoC family dehydratase N-terminal domain-containing protein [Myxococcota bacterium]